ncbi:hypothetical protein EDB84DRAFT_1484021 [Lactarius hengduanensis]|nr:hypothetical protein EDB84DRAFT_1484021 [Lactarius hengduanensis]
MTVSSEPRFVDTTSDTSLHLQTGQSMVLRQRRSTTGKRISNWEYATHAVKVENLRGRDEATLDNNGFQSSITPPSTHQLIKQLTGASRVVLFDHSELSQSAARPGVIDTPQARQPVPAVHVDQTTASAVARVQRHLPPEDIINLWRPIHHVAHDWPLALCDFNSIDRSRDLVPQTFKYPDRDGETYGVQWNENHRWKYVRGMTPEEGVLIKCFDSIQDGSVAVLTPHTAFEDPTTPPSAEKRESIELRALVFYD